MSQHATLQEKSAAKVECMLAILETIDDDLREYLRKNFPKESVEYFLKWKDETKRKIEEINDHWA